MVRISKTSASPARGCSHCGAGVGPWSIVVALLLIVISSGHFSIQNDRVSDSLRLLYLWNGIIGIDGPPEERTTKSQGLSFGSDAKKSSCVYKELLIALGTIGLCATSKIHF
jgi:hypothetical protein